MLLFKFVLLTLMLGCAFAVGVYHRSESESSTLMCTVMSLCSFGFMVTIFIVLEASDVLAIKLGALCIGYIVAGNFATSLMQQERERKDKWIAEQQYVPEVETSENLELLANIGGATAGEVAKWSKYKHYM